MLDLRALYNGDIDKIEFSFLLNPENVPSDIEFLNCVNVNGCFETKAKGSKGNHSFFQLKINIEGEYSTVCSRCAADMKIPFKLCEVFTAVDSLAMGESDNMSIVETGKSNFDIEEFVNSLILLNLPTINLCKEDCKGLCDTCGANLNYEKCKCTKKNIDPRLAILQKLLDKE